MERCISIDEKTYSYFRYEKEIDPLHLIHFLESQKLFPKMYWNERSSAEERAVWGSLLQFDHVPASFIAPQDVRLYGGKSFSEDAKKTKPWQNFPSCFFFLPQYEVIQTEEKTLLIVHSLKNSIPEIDKDFTRGSVFASAPYSTETAREDIPSLEEWTCKVNTSLRHIEKGDFHKIVLARMTTIQFDSFTRPYGLLQKLKEKKKNTTLFCLQIDPSAAFLGSTPEKLYTRKDDLLVTESLAGTIASGKTEEENAHQDQILKKSEKDSHEVALVSDFLEALLHTLGSDIEKDPSYSILQTPTVHHLYRKYSCRLNPHLTDKELLENLHPTPAVGGSPKKEALLHIQTQEEFNRGWYAGPIGWMSHQEADFAVAIRSALILNKEIHLFAGTGIVKGSDPYKEWDELESKMSQFKEIAYDA